MGSQHQRMRAPKAADAPRTADASFAVLRSTGAWKGGALGVRKLFEGFKTIVKSVLKSFGSFI
jgi:hypothetical protein